MILSFPIGILGQVWYLIVLIPDLCTLSYFNKLCCHNSLFYVRHIVYEHSALVVLLGISLCYL